MRFMNAYAKVYARDHASAEIAVILKSAGGCTDMFQYETGAQLDLHGKSNIGELYGHAKFEGDHFFVDCDWCRACDGASSGEVITCDVCPASFHKSCLARHELDYIHGSDMWLCPLCKQSLELQLACGEGDIRRAAKLIGEGIASPFWKWTSTAKFLGACDNAGKNTLHVVCERNDLAALNIVLYPFLLPETNSFCANRCLPASLLLDRDDFGETPLDVAVRLKNALECELQARATLRNAASGMVDALTPTVHARRCFEGEGEAVPISWENDVDAEPLPPYTYSAKRIEHSSVLLPYLTTKQGTRNAMLPTVEGCSCSGGYCSRTVARLCEK